MSLILSLSLNATLTDGNRHQTVALPLAWLSLPVDGWRRLVDKVETAMTVVTIGFKALSFALV